MTRLLASTLYIKDSDYDSESASYTICK